MLDCPRCGKEAKQLLIPKDGKLQCRDCSGPRPTRYNSQLNQIYAQDGETKLTNGKAWEIANRAVSKDDGRTVINKSTGKPAQY